MALIYDSRWRAEDSDGTPLSGAKLYVYTAGTTTPITLYATSALDPGSTLTNPVVADSAGRFAQIFVAEGLLVDIVEKRSDDTTVATYEDVLTVGAETGSFERDFTNSRVKISGAGGVVSIEAGDGSPDDIGGQMRLGGWASTQADSIELDAAATTTTGTFTSEGVIEGTVGLKAFGGMKVAEMVQVTGSWSSAAQVDIPLANNPSGARCYRIEIWDFVGAAGADLRARLAYDSTPNFKTGSSDYAYAYFNTYGSVATQDNANDFMFLVQTAANDTRGTTVEMTVTTPSSGSAWTVVSGRSFIWDGTGPRTYLFDAMGLGGYGRATYLRLYLNGQNSSGKYRVTALLGTGDA